MHFMGARHSADLHWTLPCMAGRQLAAPAATRCEGHIHWQDAVAGVAASIAASPAPRQRDGFPDQFGVTLPCAGVCA